MTEASSPGGADGSDKLVSVVIPTRNRSVLLREAIEAIFKQTLDPKRFEIIEKQWVCVKGTLPPARA